MSCKGKTYRRRWERESEKRMNERSMEIDKSFAFERKLKRMKKRKGYGYNYFLFKGSEQ